MLVFTRRTGEAVVIGGNVTVTVMEVKHGKIRIGIEAPMNVSVHRKEVQDKIQAQEQRLIEAQ